MGHQDEHHRDERHDTRHLTALEPVADERHGDRSRPGHADALQEPACQHHREACDISASTHPAENSARPRKAAGLRPAASDSGP